MSIRVYYHLLPRGSTHNCMAFNSLFDRSGSPLEVVVDVAGRLTAMEDRPHDQRRTRVRIPRGENPLCRGGIVGVAPYIPARIVFHAKLLVDLAVRHVYKPHREEHEIHFAAELRAGDFFHLQSPAIRLLP